MPLAPGARLGHYEILAPLGAGGMGEVYRARDTSLAREVAVKVLPERVATSPDALARFEREAQAVAALSHPNILAIHELGRQDGTAYAVMELLEGETLRQRLGGGPIPQRKALEYAVQVANGLAAAHAKGLVHRDLKPENLFVTRDGRVKILDFGLVAHQAAADDNATSSPTLGRFTDPGAVVGTVGYMSPEQVRGARVDARTDIFALGAVLFEMLTGRRAFQRDTAAETMTAILKEDAPDLSSTGRQVGVALDRIVQRCLEKSEDERFQSARDVAIALEAFSGGDSAQLPAARPRRLPRVLPAAALVLAGAALGYLAARQAGTAPSGAAPHELPRFQPITSRRGSVTNARFAGDGASVAYSAIWDSEPLRVFVTPADAARAESPPLADGSLFAVSRSGELALATRPVSDHLLVRGTVAQLPIAGGTPRELVEDSSGADWSPDGKLAVVRAGSGRTRLEFPAGSVLYESAGWLSFPRFSPDGGAIAFHEHPLHGDDRGWPALVDLKTRAKRNLTPEFASLTGLAWQPDGSEVCFANTSRVVCARIDGTGSRRVLTSHQRLALFDVARDGRLLLHAYSLDGGITAAAGGPERDLSWVQFAIPLDVDRDGRVLFEALDYGVHLRGLDGRPPVRLGAGIPAGLSPDGRLVLNIVPGDPTRLELIPTGAGETRTLPSGPIAHHSWASFAPDGRSVVVGGAEAGKGSRLFAQDVAGGEPKPISPEGVRLIPYAVRLVSPDGRFVTALGPDGRAALYPTGGGEPRPIPGLGEDLAPLGFTDRPDSIFARTRAVAHTSAVYRVDLGSGQRRLFKQLRIAETRGAPMIDIIVVSPGGEAYAYSERRAEGGLYVVSGVF
jgi:dipeptidyl aminopeptidase/acylaminoacyl peptidase